MALISIAHPKFREQLLQEAIEAKYLRPELAGRRGQDRRRARGAPHHPPAATTARRSTSAPIHPTDEPAHARPVLRAVAGDDLLPVHEPHQAHSAQRNPGLRLSSTTATTWPSSPPFPRPTARTSSPSGRYYLDEKTNLAEVAFVVRDDWQNQRHRHVPAASTSLRSPSATASAASPPRCCAPTARCSRSSRRASTRSAASRTRTCSASTCILHKAAQSRQRRRCRSSSTSASPRRRQGPASKRHDKRAQPPVANQTHA